MKLFINPSEKRFVEVRNETIGGLLISIDTNALLNDSLAALVLDSLTVSSTIDGVVMKDREIFSKINLFDLKDFIFANAVDLCGKTFQTPRALGQNNVYQLFVPFGTALNLKGSLGLYIECDNKILAPNTSTLITIETVPTIGVQSFFPKYEVLELEPMRTEHDLNLGSNVAAVIYCGNKSAAAPYDVVEVTAFSDKLNTEMTDTIVYNQLQTSPTSQDRDYEGTAIYLLNSSAHTLNDLRLKLKFKNVLGGRKLLILRKIVDTQILSNLVQKSQEHQIENVAQVRTN